MASRRKSKPEHDSDSTRPEIKLKYHTKTFEKYTPAFKFMSRRLFSNMLIFLGAVLAAIYVDRQFRSKGVTMASAVTLHPTPELVVKACAAAMPLSPCHAKQCGRFVMDSVFSNSDLTALRSLATDMIKLTPGGSGGPTILDLHSGM